MSFIRGHEPAEHAYIKGIVKEVCNKEGWTVAEEVITPNGSRVDIIAIKNGKMQLIEVTTHQIPRGLKGERRVKLEQYGELGLITYKIGESPDRSTIEKKTREFLERVRLK